MHLQYVNLLLFDLQDVVVEVSVVVVEMEVVEEEGEEVDSAEGEVDSAAEVPVVIVAEDVEEVGLEVAAGDVVVVEVVG